MGGLDFFSKVLYGHIVFQSIGAVTALLSCIQLALHPKMAAEWPTTSSSARTKPAATAEVGRVTRAALDKTSLATKERRVHH